MGINSPIKTERTSTDRHDFLIFGKKIILHNEIFENILKIRVIFTGHNIFLLRNK